MSTLKRSIFLVNTLLLLSSSVQASFNYEIERRVVDAIQNFFGVPEDMVQILHDYRDNGGFEGRLIASDRDAFGVIAHSLRSVSRYCFGARQSLANS